MIQDQAEQPADAASDGAEPCLPQMPAEAAACVPRRARQGAIDAEARHRIGRNLKLLYADVLSQPLPDRFDALLAELATRRETS